MKTPVVPPQPPTTPTGRVSVPETESCEDFGQQLHLRRSSLVVLQTDAVRVPGFVFEHEGRCWLGVPATARGALNGVSGQLIPASRDPARPSPEPIPLLIRGTVPVGSSATVDLIDVSEQQSEFSRAGMHPPPLVEPTAFWRRTVQGNLLLAMWLPSPPNLEPVMHRLLRVESLQRSDPKQPWHLRVAPAVPPEAKAAPVLDRGGFMTGFVVDPGVSGDATSLALGPDQLWAAIQSQPLDWANRKGLEATIAELTSRGFTRLAMRRTRSLRQHTFEGRYDPPAAPCTVAMLAYVSADATQRLRLIMKLADGCIESGAPEPLKNGGAPAKANVEETFSTPPKGVAMLIKSPIAAEGAKILVKAREGDPSSRLLEIHAVRETPNTLHLPRIESLLGLAPSSSNPSFFPAPGAGAPGKRGDDAASCELDQPDSVYGPTDGTGPIIRIPLHGTVGCLGDADFFNAADFRRALRSAAALRPSAIILEIESPGGRVESGRQIIGELLLAQAAGQRVVAEVRDAGSAAALITLACKEILAHPAARIGAAVTILSGPDGKSISLKKYSEESNDPELEKKHRSFADAIDDEAANVTGRSPAIAAAMRYSEAELWWSPQNKFTEKATSVADERQVDSDKTVLTLTCSEVEQYGLGKRCVSSKDVPSLLGLAGRVVQERSEEIRCTPNRVLQLFAEADQGVSEQRLAEIEAELKWLLSQP